MVITSAETASSTHTTVPKTSILIKLVRLFGALAIFGSILSYFAAIHWIPDLLSQLTVQFLAMLLPATFMAWLQKRKWLSLLLVMLMSWHLFKIVPYFFSPSDGLERRAEVPHHRLVVFNLLRTNEQFQPTLDHILATKADLVFLMEVQPAWNPYLLSIKDRYPYQKLLPDSAYTGVAILSKHPWRKLEIIDESQISNPSLDVYFQLGHREDQELHLIATHPLPPFGDALTQARDRQMMTLADRFQDEEANILCGDFNLSPWSPRFTAICEQGSLIDGSLGFGLAPTLIPLPTPLGGIKVDHVLRNRAVRVHDYQVLRTRVSDHGIVVFDFSIESH